MYNQDISELYHVCWRPQPTSVHPLGSNPFSSIPAPHVSATEYLGTKKTPSKPAGAYRPPGARGQVTPLAFKREDEGGAAYVRDGISSFSSSINGFGKHRSRVVPGAETVEEKGTLPPGAAPGGGVSLTGTGEGADGEPLSKAAKKNAKKREAKKAAAAATAAAEVGPAPANLTPPTAGTPSKSPSRSPERRQGKGHDRNHSKSYSTAPPVPPGFGLEATPGHRRERSRSGGRRSRTDTGSSQHHSQPNGAPKAPTQTPVQKPKALPIHTMVPASIPPAPPTPTASQQDSIPDLEVTSPSTPGASAGSSQEKKVRGLLKKIRAIEDLKMRHAGGEPLEDTQLKKIMSEDGVRKELAAIGRIDG